MPDDLPRTEELLAAAAKGDANAGQELLEEHRDKLQRMIEVRMDTRLRTRCDPSDVVQETLLVAARGMADYARKRPLPFYPWLRKLARQRLIDLQRRHIDADRRSVLREESPAAALSGESLHELAERLATSEPSPSSAVEQAERAMRLREALDQLEEVPREVLLLRFLEDLSVAEVAAVLEISEDAVKMRQLRALRRLKEILNHSADDHA